MTDATHKPPAPALPLVARLAAVLATCPGLSDAELATALGLASPLTARALRASDVRHP